MDIGFDDLDELFSEAINICCDTGKASASLLQRRLSIGYARAARLIDQLEKMAVVSSPVGSSPRQVLIKDPKEFSLDKASLDKRKRDLLKKKIGAEWVDKDLTTTFSNKPQEKLGKSKKINLPIGLNKNKLVSLPITEAGNVYVFPGAVSNHIGFVKNTIDQLTTLYNPETIKFIVADETRMLTYLDGSPHLLTPVITDHQKLVNALRWCTAEMERRTKLCAEVGQEILDDYEDKRKIKLPRIIITLNYPSGMLGFFDDEIYYKLDRLLSLGHLFGIHTYIVSGLNDKRLTKLLTAIPTKIIFKTHSVYQADILGTDDAFGLKDKNEFLFIPPFGKLQKLKVA